MNKLKIMMLISILLTMVSLGYFYLSSLKWDHFILMIAYPVLSIISIKLDNIGNSNQYYYFSVYFILFLILSLFNLNSMIELLVLLSFYGIGRTVKIPLITMMTMLLLGVYVFTAHSRYTFDLGCLICLLGLLIKFKHTGIGMIDGNSRGPFI
ncbi:hypothetical protein [Beduini massiliensis]|uniref:hypothetical protein n=1 Tax=Beduini massiliensis TaxID=1585974 RepID=UPI00059AA202|nr:hypothetical protein [Beduini massiliensis]